MVSYVGFVLKTEGFLSNSGTRRWKLMFSKPDEWPKWFQRFQRFRIACELMEKEESIQVNTLIYVMGNEAEDIFKSFQLSANNAKKFKTVLDKFSEHFVKRRKIIFKRAKFNQK